MHGALTILDGEQHRCLVSCELRAEWRAEGGTTDGGRLDARAMEPRATHDGSAAKEQDCWMLAAACLGDD